MDVLNRIKSGFGIGTDVELSEFLGVSQPTVANWKRRKTLDYDLIISKCAGVNFHWLFTGEGEMYANNEAGRALRAKHKPDELEVLGNAKNVIGKNIVTEEELAVLKSIIQRSEKPK